MRPSSTTVRSTPLRSSILVAGFCLSSGFGGLPASSMDFHAVDHHAVGALGATFAGSDSVASVSSGLPSSSSTTYAVSPGIT